MRRRKDFVRVLLRIPRELAEVVDETVEAMNVAALRKEHGGLQLSLNSLLQRGEFRAPDPVPRRLNRSALILEAVEAYVAGAE